MATDIISITGPNVFARISSSQIANRPLKESRPTLYGARTELLEVGYSSLSLVSTGSGKTIGLYIPVPKGEVWAVQAARYRLVGNVATAAYNNAAIWLPRNRIFGSVVNPPEIQWTAGVQQELVRATGYDSDTAVGGIAEFGWSAYLGGAAGQNIGLPIWEGDREVLFMVANNSGGAVTISALSFSLWLVRIPLGETLLEELRQESISDVELQRRLQAIATAGIAQMPVNV